MIEVVPFDMQYADEMLAIAQQIHAKSIYWDIPLDGGKLVGQLLMAGTDKSPDRWFRLALFEGHVVGGFYGTVLRVFFGSGKIIKDMGQWVAPGFRGRGAHSALLAEFEAWGRSIGACKSIIAYNGLEDIEEKRRVFEWQGYQVTGYNTEKEL